MKGTDKTRRVQIPWRSEGSGGSYDRHSIYSFVARSGRYYTKTISEYAGVVITRYPSEAYYEHWLSGENKGARAREWVRA
jgi:hypothetical protein